MIVFQVDICQGVVILVKSFLPFSHTSRLCSCHSFQDASESGMLKIGVKPSALAHHLFAMLPAHLPVSVEEVVVGSRRGSSAVGGLAFWAWHRLRDTEQ